jgi:hypothetical protein
MSSNQNNRGLETIPFQIVNQSGLDAPLYIWIQGIIPDKTPNEYVYANDFKGNVADMPKSLTKATFSMLLPAKDHSASSPRVVACLLVVRRTTFYDNLSRWQSYLSEWLEPW